jgi:hypothetical protein
MEDLLDSLLREVKTGILYQVYSVTCPLDGPIYLGLQTDQMLDGRAIGSKHDECLLSDIGGKFVRVAAYNLNKERSNK